MNGVKRGQYEVTQRKRNQETSNVKNGNEHTHSCQHTTPHTAPVSTAQPLWPQHRRKTAPDFGDRSLPKALDCIHHDSN
ncbi:hypothetical protein SKAU_G00124020 [Synaphobranchus kaupii]|uniref:Uncharacterized protein n=1 Tax=Synaphobranchus kaupii TaxID=118154 RepID=A0A9Q1FPM6_SYNKA|nr:hypothetical protein SKAU_G00124020 [Synaphobranchus kaupii]